jgi:uncharacterized protein (TIGR02118 family)
MRRRRRSRPIPPTKTSRDVAVFKVIWLVKFRKDMDRDEVLRWWRGHHGDMAAKTPGMVRYVQSHWLAPIDPATQMPIEGAEPQFDGHAEHWFETRETYEAAMASEEWKQTQEDGPGGFDSSTLVGGVVEQHEVI